MKPILLATAILLALIPSGCMQNQFNQMAAEAKTLENKMSEDYLKKNIVIGKTTESEVRGIYGKPMFETGGAGHPMMADRMWTYAATFTEFNQDIQNTRKRRTTRSLVFSFKNGVVASYNFSSH
jgi:hypothetical protein